MRHTPGPWEAVEIEEGLFYIYSPKKGGHLNPVPVAIVDHRKDGHVATRTITTPANARLIAAAPELYDFIATLENDDDMIPDWLWKKRNELLAKVRGEAGAQ